MLTSIHCGLRPNVGHAGHRQERARWARPGRVVLRGLGGGQASEGALRCANCGGAAPIRGASAGEDFVEALPTTLVALSFVSFATPTALSKLLAKCDLEHLWPRPPRFPEHPCERVVAPNGVAEGSLDPEFVDTAVPRHVDRRFVPFLQRLRGCGFAWVAFFFGRANFGHFGDQCPFVA